MGNYKECTKTNHQQPPRECSKKNCPVMVCSNCRNPRSNGDIYCLLCEMTVDGSLADEFCMMDDDEEMIAKSQIYGTQTTASVRINTKTGKIGGWESLFELLEMDNEYLAIDYDDADEQAE